MQTSIEIAQKSHPLQITEIAKRVGLRPEEIEPHGPHKAKVSLDVLTRLGQRPNGKLIVVTAMTPTKQGEGKTCTSIVLTQALAKLGKRSMVCIRQPSLAPTFGVKGGGTGGGFAQLLPMEDINLHFTGDIHAVEYAHNLLASIIGNHIFRGNALDLDTERILWRRVIDVPDRELRSLFDITASSEIMAILALSHDLKDLSRRLSRIVVGFNRSGKPVTVADLHLEGSLTLILRDASRPNLVQTLEGQGAFVHTGPYANVAHGNSSVIATQIALKLVNYVVTESGFGSDLGLEKFFDIVCRQAHFKPDAVVLVCSVKALRSQGDPKKDDSSSLKEGLANLKRHIENIQKFGMKPIVTVNRFSDDKEWEIGEVKAYVHYIGAPVVVSEGYTKGSKGAMELAEKVLQLVQENGNRFKFLYPLTLSLREKIETLARFYGAKGVQVTKEADTALTHLSGLGFEGLPINMAKTHLSFSDDPTVKGAPADWTLHVKDLRIAAGAGFVNCIAGNMLLLPGLPEEPIAQKITIDDAGKIKGLF